MALRVICAADMDDEDDDTSYSVSQMDIFSMKMMLAASKRELYRRCSDVLSHERC